MKEQKTVVIAMSGGVDSSVAALLLKNQGFRVIGAFMKNFSDTKNPLSAECAWIEEKKMAQKIAGMLEIPFITLDLEKQFKKQVINYLYKAYSKNQTPNPDILCNKTIKFPLLWKEAKKFNADYIATGHYARIKKTNNSFELLTGKDKTKDQSYFLSQLSQSDLSHTLFPLGNLKKSEVRKIAQKNNFPNFSKKSTSGICFVGKVNLKSFLNKEIKDKEGKIIDPKSNTLGTHSGTFYFTIGQRIGPRLGVKITKHLNGKWYVAGKNKNTLIIAPKNHPLLKKTEVTIKNFNKISKSIPKSLKARIRHLGSLHEGKLIKNGNSYNFKFKKPIEQIAEGQFIVLYNKDKVVASGEIRY